MAQSLEMIKSSWCRYIGNSYMQLHTKHHTGTLDTSFYLVHYKIYEEEIITELYSEKLISKFE